MPIWKGERLTVEIVGASHEKEIGVRISGLPCEEVRMESVLAFLSRRKPGLSGTTERIEEDIPCVLGMEGDMLSKEVEAIFANRNVNASDYKDLYGKPRPSHADYAAYLKDGRLDFSGGGEFSGRMTAPLCFAGGIAKDLLLTRGIKVYGYISEIGGIVGKNYKNAVLTESDFPIVGFPSLSGREDMENVILRAKSSGDSVGGRVDCVVFGMKGGFGGALFSGLEGKIAQLLFAIPGVKGVEFGEGFSFSSLTGSRANDALTYENGEVLSVTNKSGGINGGISNGMPITLSAVFRPTPSIGLPQKTVDLQRKENTEIRIRGRHDACIAVRAVPVVESAVALALLDGVL